MTPVRRASDGTQRRLSARCHRTNGSPVGIQIHRLCARQAVDPLELMGFSCGSLHARSSR